MCKSVHVAWNFVEDSIPHIWQLCFGDVFLSGETCYAHITWSFSIPHVTHWWGSAGHRFPFDWKEKIMFVGRERERVIYHDSLYRSTYTHSCFLHSPRCTHVILNKKQKHVHTCIWGWSCKYTKPLPPHLQDHIQFLYLSKQIWI